MAFGLPYTLTVWPVTLWITVGQVSKLVVIQVDYNLTHVVYIHIVILLCKLHLTEIFRSTHLVPLLEIQELLFLLSPMKFPSFSFGLLLPSSS